MTVSNGQLANQTSFNDAFMSRDSDTDTTGRVDLLNALAASGASVANVQRFVNAVASMLGITTAEVYNFLVTWSEDYVGAANDTVIERINALVERFAATGGHDHTGVDGEGPQIAASALSGLNYYRASTQKIAVTSASGGSTDVSSLMTGKVAGGTSTTPGVVVSGVYNRVSIINTLTEDRVEDAGGQIVYGRLSFSSPTWTLTYYTNEAGVETPYSFASPTNITAFFLEVFDLSTLPTFSDSFAEFGSLDTTADVAEATATIPGKVSTSAQTFGGAKTFNGNVELVSLLQGSITTDAATTGAGATMAAPAKLIHRLTNGSLVSISSIPAPTKPVVVIVRNETGNTISIVNADSTTTDINTGTGASVDVEDQAAFILFYDLTAQRWVMIAGGSGGSGGDVVGPASSTNNGFAKFDGTTGKLLKDSAAVISLADGGTNKALTAVAGGVVWTDVDSMEVTAAGSAGQLFRSNGTSAPSFQYDEILSSTKTANYSILNTDSIIVCNANAGSFTVTLPTAVGIAGKVFTIKRIDQNLATSVTIATTSSQTIEQSATSRKLSIQTELFRLVSDGANWVVLNHQYYMGWTSYTPTGSWSTNTTYAGRWKRVGDEMLGQITVATSGAPTAATLTANLPSGVTIDTAKLTIADFAKVVGYTGLNDSASTGYDGPTTYATTTAVGPKVRQVGNPTRFTPIDNTTPFTFGSGDYVNIEFRVPITDWEP